MNRYLRYLWYNLTHEQIALVINNYFKFDTAIGKLESQREQFCFCTYTYWHHLENLSYQTHTKLWALKSSFEGTFLTKRPSETIVACSMLRVKNRSIGPELMTAKTGPIHLSSLVEIAFVDWFTKLLLINISIYMNI